MVSRRKFISISAATAVLGGVYFFGIHRAAKPGVTLKHRMTMMGTTVNFTIFGPDKETSNDALQKAIAHMEKEGAIINTYIPDSPISILNRNGVLENGPPTLLRVIQMAQDMAALTDGAFDPTVFPLLRLYRQLKKTGSLPPENEVEDILGLVDYRKIKVDGTTVSFDLKGMGITLDAIGKGYIVDQGVKILNDLGFSNVCIEAGGDLMVTGNKGNGTPWTIGIANPRPEDDRKQFIVKLKNRAIATSGDYMQPFSSDRKYHHIINPATGFSPPELASCSILAPSVAMADGLATSAMVMGPVKSIALLDSLPECAGFLIGKDLKTYTSKDFFS